MFFRTDIGAPPRRTAQKREAPKSFCFSALQAINKVGAGLQSPPEIPQNFRRTQIFFSMP
jgi:hypothetical protein